MQNKKILTIIIASLFLAALIIGGFFAYKYYFSQKNQKTAEAPKEKNYFEINDESAGVSFKISKKFERMPARDLQIKNANFIYGFSASDDKTVACYISQTRRDKPGVVKVSELRDGVFAQMKKTFPDARLDSAEIMDIGENNNKGARLKISYTDGNIPKFQWEAAGITDKTASFAFCEFPRAVIDLYKEDVNLFLDSIKLKQ